MLPDAWRGLLGSLLAGRMVLRTGGQGMGGMCWSSGFAAMVIGVMQALALALSHVAWRAVHEPGLVVVWIVVKVWNGRCTGQ